MYAAVEFLATRADDDGLIDTPPNPYPLWMVALDGAIGKAPCLKRLLRDSLDTARRIMEGLPSEGVVIEVFIFRLPVCIRWSGFKGIYTFLKFHSDFGRWKE